MMIHRTLIAGLCFLGSFSIAMAQEEKPATVVKSGGMEMKAVDERPNSVIILSPASAKGDFDKLPHHPECEGKEGQESLDCTAAQIRKLSAEKLGAPGLDMEQWGSSAVAINFTINQFGEVKDIRVDHSGDQELSKKLIVALYDLPKFDPATKEGKAVNSSMQVNYRYEELFRK